MDDNTSQGDRQIDAAEANRLAQDLDRQAHPEIPEFRPDAGEAVEADRSTIPDVERNPPDRNLEERVWPPVVESPTEIGGGPDAIEALTEEERR
jgi:hypothetical protein